ncbi:hypothetical protein L484_006782 [Morus notabilis]|uniref:Uncharacterized protein n=1 Tax=Morus notabilis TaxID=981085 RepID=W9S549_9ROSA|nr:hypothetical protein L484_006782 [Morus notabilis]
MAVEFAPAEDRETRAVRRSEQRGRMRSFRHRRKVGLCRHDGWFFVVVTASWFELRLEEALGSRCRQ